MSYQKQLSFLWFGLLLLMVNADGPYPPALPSSVYGPPSVIKVVTTSTSAPIESSYKYPIPIVSKESGPYPPARSTEAPSSPASVYGVPTTSVPVEPAPVYGVPNVTPVAPVKVIKTSYEYVIPEQPSTTTTLAPSSPALVYGVPSTTLPPPPPTEARASPASVYGVPSTQPPPTSDPVETSYNYTIPLQPVKPVVKEGPYPAPIPEVPTGPYPAASTSPPLAPYPAAVYVEAKVEAPIVPIKSSYEYNLPIVKVEPSTEEPSKPYPPPVEEPSKPYPPPVPSTVPPSPVPVYGVPEVKIIPTNAPVVPVESKYMFLIPPQPVKPIVEEKVVFLAPYPAPHAVYGAPSL